MNEPASAQPEELLRQGIALAKARRRDEARALLLQVIELDEENETAWLWLSGVVDTLADRRICLENVLTINPDNQAARRGLDRLPPPEPDPGSSVDEEPAGPARQAPPPISPAAAVLYPERQARPPAAKPAAAPPPAAAIGYQSYSTFDDVWARESAICPYCAHEVDEDARQCPNCKRNLTTTAFQFEKPSSNFYLYLTVLNGLLLTLAYETLLTWILPVPLATRLGLTSFMGLMLVVTAGVAGRQGWAHIAGTVGLFVLLAVKALPLPLVGDWFSFDPSLYVLSGDQKLLIGAYNLCAAPVQLITTVGGLVFSLLLVRPAFARRTYQLLGRVDRSLREGTEFYLAGRRLAEKGMWASAVLHWQRAVAQEPARFSFQRALAEGYTQLGFKARARDIYRQARGLTNDPGLLAEIDVALAALE